MDLKGIDWTELSKHFGIIDNDYECWKDDKVLRKTRKFLQDKLFTDQEIQVEIVLRMFLEKLYENSIGIKENAPIWKGLLEVKGDFTLIKYSIILLEHMWY